MIDLTGTVKRRLCDFEDNRIVAHRIDVALWIHNPKTCSVSSGQKHIFPNSHIDIGLASWQGWKRYAEFDCVDRCHQGPKLVVYADSTGRTPDFVFGAQVHSNQNVASCHRRSVSLALRVCNEIRKQLDLTVAFDN